MPVHFSSEQAFIDAAVGHLACAGIDAFVGVPCLSRCIDLVILQAGETIAVEFKLNDWQRGLAQAQDHLLAVDRTYVCLPPRKVTDMMAQRFSGAGVGLLLYVDSPGWPFDDVLAAPKSTIKWNPAEKALRRFLDARRHGNDSIDRER